MARENPGWGYDRIVGALANLGHQISDQTVGNILRRHGIAPAPKRSQATTWKDFIASHMAVLAGVDFFTVEVLTWRGLATYYVLFFLHLESRRVSMAGITRHPTAEWMEQMARNATDESAGYVRQYRYVLHDRDTKFCASFRAMLTSGGVQPLMLPPRSPNLNAFAERWVRMSEKRLCAGCWIRTTTRDRRRSRLLSKHSASGSSWPTVTPREHWVRRRFAFFLAFSCTETSKRLQADAKRKLAKLLKPRIQPWRHGRSASRCKPLQNAQIWFGTRRLVVRIHSPDHFLTSPSLFGFWRWAVLFRIAATCLHKTSRQKRSSRRCFSSRRLLRSAINWMRLLTACFCRASNGHPCRSSIPLLKNGVRNGGAMPGTTMDHAVEEILRQLTGRGTASSPRPSFEPGIRM